MTTIDRATWPSGCIKQGSCARHGMCMYIGFRKPCPHSLRDITAEIEAAALRQPDQKGEAVEHCAYPNCDCETDYSPCKLPRPHPAPEAGKLPSEEDVARVLAKAMGYPPDKFWEIYALQARAVLALLSPAQPHDVDASKDGFRALIGQLRFEAEPAGDARTNVEQIFATAAEALEEQGRRIAELELALRDVCQAALPLGNVAFNIGQRTSLVFTEHERETIARTGRDLDEARRRAVRSTSGRA